ncbi:MOP flippase family protein [uncultured Tenacibaculum sp.]|uniref:MOP flippase family protein n=1 Tax=uncultured Tenacibaculum sp. TaxID=174713 RepID=UPI0026054632|nr:MOP flippase family protein [uncultured Tenacibaculum sp.]
MSLKKHTISGVKWTTLSTIMLTLAGILKLSVLARYLSTEDFGLMALVTFVLGFMNLFMDMGLTSAILHKQNITNKQYSSLYWLNVLFSLLLFASITLFSGIIANFYNEKELSILIPLMGLSIIFFALGNQYKIIEQKELNFKYIALVEILSSILGIILAIILAVKNHGVYALVYSALLQHGISNFFFFFKGTKQRGILLYFNIEETKPFLKIGIYQIGGQIINYFNRDLDVLVIGKFFGTDILGGYSLAKQLIRRPLQIVGPVLNRVSMSIFPRFQDNNRKLIEYFKKLFTITGILNAMIYGSMVILAHWLVLLFYGERLLDIVPYVQLFALVTYLRAMAGNTGILVVTTGRTDYNFVWNIIITFIIPIAIYLGALVSIEIVILSLGIVQLLLLIPNWYIFFHRLIKYPFSSYIKTHIYPLAISLAYIFLFRKFNESNWLICMLFTLLLLISLSSYSYFAVVEVKSIFKKFLRKHDRI